MNSDDIINKINSVKKAKNAVILAHNYQLPEIQEIADYVGDSLELARKSQHIDKKIVVFCGVYFMAEITKILNPEKIVLMPDLHAGCPMADMITPEKLEMEIAKRAGAAVICYVNSNANIKALSDICCTSANGVKVAQSIQEDQIIFVPDKYLGSFISKKVPDKEFFLWAGYCPTHMVFSQEGLLKTKEKYPEAKILVHPECRLDVQAIADEICSTSQMIRYAQNNPARTFIICTEVGMLYRLRKENPGKEFIPGSPNAICPNMKLTTLEKVLWSLEDLKFQIEVEDSTRERSLKSIERMLKI